MGKLIYIFLALLWLPVLAAPVPVPAKPKPAPSSVQPSRYAGQDLKAYTSSLAAKMLITSRVTDPFGQPQDPTAKPVVKPTTQRTTKRPTAEPPTPFSDIINRIEISTVMPKDKRFLIGERVLGQGDTLPIRFRSRLLQVEITEVSARRIVFRNVESGEIGVRSLDLLPPGMTHGVKGLTPPGMSPAQSALPLEIEPPAPPAGTTNL